MIARKSSFPHQPRPMDAKKVRLMIEKHKLFLSQLVMRYTNLGLSLLLYAAFISTGNMDAFAQWVLFSLSVSIALTVLDFNAHQYFADAINSDEATLQAIHKKISKLKLKILPLALIMGCGSLALQGASNPIVFSLVSISVMARLSYHSRYYYEVEKKYKNIIFNETLMNIIFSVIKVYIILCTESIICLFVVYTIEWLLIGLLYYNIAGKGEVVAVAAKKAGIVNLNSASSLIVISLLWLAYTKVDVYVATYFGTAADIVQINLATKIIDVLNAILAAYTFSKLTTGSGPETILKKITLILDGGKKLALFIIFVLNLLVGLFGYVYPNEGAYSDLPLYLHIYSATIILYFYTGVSARVLFHFEKVHITALRHSLGLLLNLMLSIILYSQIGVIGIVISTVLALTFTSLLLDLPFHHTRGLFGKKVFIT